MKIEENEQKDEKSREISKGDENRAREKIGRNDEDRTHGKSSKNDKNRARNKFNKNDENRTREKDEKSRKKWRIFFKRVFVFFTVFFSVLAVIEIDETASNTIGNESLFSSYFVRTGERTVEVKILGFHTSIVDGLIVFDE